MSNRLSIIDRIGDTPLVRDSMSVRRSSACITAAGQVAILSRWRVSSQRIAACTLRICRVMEQRMQPRAE